VNVTVPDWIAAEGPTSTVSSWWSWRERWLPRQSWDPISDL